MSLQLIHGVAHTQSPSMAATDLPAEVEQPEITLLHPITRAQRNQAPPGPQIGFNLGLSVAVRKSLNHALESNT